MKKKVIMLSLMVIAILFIIPLSIRLLSGDNRKKEVAILNHKKAEGLYTKSDNLCTDVPEGDNIALFLIFGQMKRDKILSDSIDMDTYRKEASKIVKDAPNSVNYVYEGYRYTSEGNIITRSKVECSDKSYVSKLYGYSMDEDKLYLTINSGYVSNNIVYNLEGNEIGEYNKENINTTLDKGSMKSYTYLKSGDGYIFEEVKD